MVQKFDIVIVGGTVYDGSGGEGRRADVAIINDRIAGVGDYKDVTGADMIDATGMAVAPGFINMLSWSTESLIQDGRSQSEIRQGVTTEIMGEGESMGPVNDRVRESMLRQQSDIKYKTSVGRRSPIICAFYRNAVFRATWRRSSERLRFGNTLSDSKTNSRRLNSSRKCANWFGKKWRQARSVLGRR